MKHYLCTVVDPNRERRTLTLTAPNQESLVWDLNRQGYVIVAIKEQDEVAEGSANRSLKLSAQVILEFTKTFFVLLTSGLGLKEALQVGSEIFTGQKQGGLFINALRDAVGKGHTLTQAIDRFSPSLGSLYVGLVRIGERAGNLTPIFEKLADYLQTRKQLRDKIIGSLMYPALVLSITLGGMGLLMTFVLPKLYEIVAAFKKSSSQQFQGNLAGFQTGLAVAIVSLIGLGAVIAGILIMRQRSADFRLQFDRILWRLPLVGAIVETLDGLYFSFAMETLLTAGYSLDQSLIEASLTVRNTFFRQEILAVREEVLKGADLSASMEGRGSFSPRMLLWIRVGEQAGEIAKSFSQLREYYQQAVEKGSARLMTLVEPVLIVVVGIILVILISNVVTPIFGMMGGLL